jgi:undecaprenyl pyrophosphate synthase
LKEIIFPAALNSAVEETTNKKNQLPAEENNLRNTQLEMEGQTALAEGQKDAIIQNATSIVNNYKANFFQEMNVDNDYISKNLQVLQSFNVSMNFATNEETEKRNSMFKML